MEEDHQKMLTQLLIQSTETHGMVRTIDERTKKHDISLYGRDGLPGVVTHLDRLLQREESRRIKEDRKAKRRWGLMIAIWSACLGAIGGFTKKIWDYF